MAGPYVTAKGCGWGGRRDAARRRNRLCAGDPHKRQGHTQDMKRAGLDYVATAASALALVMLAVYLLVIRQQEGQPASWAVGALLVGAGAAGYGASLTAPYRRGALVLAGLALSLLGVLAILTIGLPILVAGGLCLLAVVRQRPAPSP